MESFAQINVLLAAYGGMFLVTGVQWELLISDRENNVSLEFHVVAAASCGCGAALVLLPLLATHVARAARACLAVLYAFAMLVLVVSEVAVAGWLASRRMFSGLRLDAQTPAPTWAGLGLLAVLGVLQLAALALGARRACHGRPRLVTSATAWKPM